MTNNYQHFGVLAINVQTATKMAKSRSYKVHNYVPSRKEVASLDVGKLTEILTGWMCNSPTEIIPSRTQIAEVKDILISRSDVSQLAGLITMCNYYINGE